MYPTITSLQTSSQFRYLWLKYVTGIDLEQHCAKCLLGNYSKHVGVTVESPLELTLDEYPAQAFYLCGVSKPYRWSNNFHLAFVFKKGSLLEVDELGVRVEIRDAKRISITQREYDHPLAVNPIYRTCRNWQFAHIFKDLYG